MALCGRPKPDVQRPSVRVGGVGDEELGATVQRALGAFSNGAGFAALRKRVMKLDVSWERSARRYEHIYRTIRPT